MSIAARFAGRVGHFPLDLAFEVPETGVTGLFGPSGAGKTSLLRCLAGLAKVDGRLAVGNEIWQDAGRFLPAEQRRVGYVFQGANLLPHLSVRDNLAYARRRAPQERFGFDEVVARTGIAALLDRSPGQLSGGEEQRAGIARALLGQPRLLLMDEPLSALDTAARRGMTEMLAELFAGLDLPVFYVSHDAAEVARLAQRTIILEAGRIAATKAINRPPG